MKQRIFSIPFLIFGLATAAFSQVPDSVKALQALEIQQDTLPIDTLQNPIAADSSGAPVADSASAKKPGFLKKLFKEDYPNPKKAILMSVAFPGAGQIYNKRWWKAPIVWAGYGGLIYAIGYNTRNYKRLRDAYILELHDMPHEFEGIYDAGDLKALRDGFDKNRQKSYIGVVLLHIVQAAEAFVDCHLKTFDVSDDLSLRVEPSFGTLDAGEFYSGIGLKISFH